MIAAILVASFLWNDLDNLAESSRNLLAGLVVLDEGDGGDLLAELLEDDEAVNDLGLPAGEVESSSVLLRAKEGLAANVDFPLKKYECLK